ncbi:MFS transporter [Microlunatus speluncae]|uniref:MFS transporter n=1 Tax=Microlunatus speluncae TaxID=2594267 RepID=UPI0012664357|nr:MFS transporter [Microlunatus speluncae]
MITDQGGSAWRLSRFRLFWGGQTLSGLGDQVSAIAVPILAVVLLEASATQMGLLGAASRLPIVLFGLAVGVWVDRVRRRRLMIMTDLARAGVLLMIPLAAAAGLLGLPLLYGVAFIVATLGVVFQISASAFLRTLLPAARLIDGNARLTQSRALTQISGPGLGGALVQAVTAPVAIMIDIASYLLSALALTRIRVEEPAVRPGARRAVWREVYEGCRVIWRSPILRASAASAGTYNLFHSAVLAVEVIFLARDLGLSAVQLGIVLGAVGPGALVGATLAVRAGGRWGIGPVMIAGLALAGLANLALPLAAGPPSVIFVVIVVASFGSGFGQPFYNVNQGAVRQALVGVGLQGRVTATMSVVAGGAAPLGALLGGLLADRLGVRPLLIIAALGTIGAAAWLLASPVRRLRELPGVESS